MLVIGLLLLASQVISLAHAVEHPFHAPDEICAAFASFEHNNLAVAVLPPGIESLQLADNILTSPIRAFFNLTCLCQQPRAPPLHT
jgi:hypothetical protein